ncbi:MAG: NAD(P)H-hydrate dehydratase, partial [Saprospiraceae bacterium]|nr:NAD(P)H-hydrate dehydratase [Saprospiraceae bacterium]
DIKNIILPRNKFSYKNNFGHMLLIAGSKSMCGASILSAKAAMRSGLGLIAVITDTDCKAHLFSQFPEAMVNEYEEFFPLIINKFNSICVGSGMKGIENMESILNKCYSAKISMILDAEAIQALASNPNLLKKIPANTILTPHIGEFEKLVNKKFENSIDRLQFAASFALKHKIIIVLKGSNTCVINSDGMQYFNTTGNQGMATAGSGDVLAGIIGSLLAQSYQPIHAAIIGVYIHGLSGDLALKKQSYESMIASDISENLGDAFKELEPKELF